MSVSYYLIFQYNSSVTQKKLNSKKGKIIMSWNEVDNKHKKKDDRHFVSCTEYYERKYIVDSTMESFPDLSKQKIEAAVSHCCSKIPAPRSREKFWKCMGEYLGVS